MNPICLLSLRILHRRRSFWGQSFAFKVILKLREELLEDITLLLYLLMLTLDLLLSRCYVVLSLLYLSFSCLYSILNLLVLLLPESVVICALLVL